MSDLERYTRAMVAGMHSICAAIEQKHDLYGYSPEIVSVGLRAVEEGRDPYQAVDDYLSGEEKP